MLIKPFPKLENIHAIPIPMPEPPELITANVYAVGKGPVTLIDTGPKTPGSLAFIQRHGLAVGIQETVGHPVSCFIHSQDRWRVSSDTFQEVLWSKEADQFMSVAGIPQKEIETVKKRFSSFKTLCDPLSEISTMEDGDEFTGDGYRLRLIHTPGHTPGTCCLYESRQKILFSGDHIIKHITPNPFIELKRHHLCDPHYQSLRAYSESLDKLTGLEVRFVFPGHGEYIEDLLDIISTYRVHHRERMELVWNALKKKSRPLYDIIDDVFACVPEGHLFLAISEIFVHLEILINEGRAELADPGPPALYRAL